MKKTTRKDLGCAVVAGAGRRRPAVRGPATWTSKAASFEAIRTLRPAGATGGVCAGSAGHCLRHTAPRCRGAAAAARGLDAGAALPVTRWLLWPFRRRGC